MPEKKCRWCIHSSSSELNYWYCNKEHVWVRYDDVCNEFDDKM